MRRILILLCTFAMALGLLIGVGGAASAASGASTTSPAALPVDDNCNHYSGGGSGALVPGGATYVWLDSTGARIASAQLCHQDYRLFWGYVVFHDTMPVGKWGTAVLQIDRDGQGGPISSWSCDSPLYDYQPPNGANRYVKPGQTRCWTPKISADFEVDYLRVVGYRVNDPHPGGSRDALGVGAWR
jgi:hypothetical protein